MKRFLCIAAGCLSLAGAAHAVALAPTPGGGWTGSFVQAANGEILDTFSFTPTSVSGEVKIDLTPLTGQVTFFTALLNGQGFGFSPSGGGTSFSFDARVTADQPLQLLVTGFSGDAGTLTAMGGSYGGQVTVTAVPEPAAIALMLAGLGVIGVARGRRRQPTPVVEAA